MRMATVEKEWAEVRRKGQGKVEDWSWTVTFYEGEWIEMNDWIDRHYINNEADAEMIATLFECGAYSVGEFGELCFDDAFS
jgi:hypothetical protein